MKLWLLLFSICAYFSFKALALPLEEQDETKSAEIQQAIAFFERENELLRQQQREAHIAAWNYNTNVSEDNRLRMIDIAAANAERAKQLAQRIQQAGYAQLEDADIQRQARLLSNLGDRVLSDSDYKLLQNAISSMQTNYAQVKACAYENKTKCDLKLEPHLQERLAKSRDARELQHYWTEWYNKAGTPEREHFSKYVQLGGKAAKANNYSSVADYWLHFYEDPDFENNLDAAYQAILPLYEQIHGYVRHRLRQHYGEELVKPHGCIPMHLLGNMWAQSWEEAMDLFTPYPEEAFVNVTAEMQRQGYNTRKLFQLGDEFFKSLGMRALPESFWNLSVLEKPNDREIVCHASAWDLFEASDVRIKMCTEVNAHYLYVVHHELGHIQYYLQYEHQPTVYRGAAHPGFHEAVGDVIGLSVLSPRHLHRIGLSPITTLDEKSRINELFRKAVSRLVLLPWCYFMDKYRYAVFRGEIPESHWNRGFWQMRANLTGMQPPVPRTDADFDPPAKYHISADVEYLRYFTSLILQFQFHKALLTKAGQYSPNDGTLTLDNGDIYENLEAGAAFSKFLSIGKSKHWKEALQEFTGESNMDATALLEYFQPLKTWLEAENKRLNVDVGWSKNDLEKTNESTAN